MLAAPHNCADSRVPLAAGRQALPSASLYLVPTALRWIPPFGKWLKAGVLDTDGQVLHPATGVPQGGIVSPILANVYLHYALDLWFEKRVKANRRSAMKFSVTIDRDEDGVWIAECPSIPGCVSQGTTKDEALDNIKEAIQLCLEVRAEKGIPLTIETRQVEVAA